MRHVHALAIGALAALLIAPSAHADCTATEYAQYRDQARDRTNHPDMAQLYCFNKAMSEIRPGTSESRQCNAEMNKILGALSAVKAHSTIKFAIAGCPKKTRP